MRRNLRVIAASLAVLCVGIWIAFGANRGWTETTSTWMAKDPVTDIEYPVVEASFRPGVDLLGVGLLVSALLAGVSFAFKPKQKH